MIIITGASGYIGSRIAKQLVASGKPVRAMVYNQERAEREGRLAGLDIPIVEADIRKVDSLQSAFQARRLSSIRCGNRKRQAHLRGNQLPRDAQRA
jgi:uncharacterized protein YbjT (DUF2867 family)